MSVAHLGGPENEGSGINPITSEELLSRTPDNLLDLEAKRQSQQRSRRWGIKQTAISTIGIGLVAVAGWLGWDHFAQTPAVMPTPQKIETAVPATATIPSHPTEVSVVIPTTAPTSEPTKEVVVEKPTSLNAKNMDQFTRKVSQDEYQKLIELQPDNFAFPLTSDKGDFVVTYTTQSMKDPALKGEYKELKAKGAEMSLILPLGGIISFAYFDQDSPDKISNINLVLPISNNSGYVVSISAISNATLAADITPVLSDLTARQIPGGKELRGQAKEGQLAAKINGNISISISHVETLDKSVKIQNPDGSTRTFDSYTTYVTPEIFNVLTGASNNWLRTSDGKIAIPQN